MKVGEDLAQLDAALAVLRRSVHIVARIVDESSTRLREVRVDWV
jgi:hypothetical protein